MRNCTFTFFFPIIFLVDTHPSDHFLEFNRSTATFVSIKPPKFRLLLTIHRLQQDNLNALGSSRVPQVLWWSICNNMSKNTMEKQ